MKREIEFRAWDEEINNGLCLLKLILIIHMKKMENFTIYAGINIVK